MSVKEQGGTPGYSWIAREILAYLVEHPRAQDSLEGITEWWMLERAIKRWAAKVRGALSKLVAHNLVLERKIEGGKILYCLNRRRIAEVRALLEPFQDARRGNSERVTFDHSHPRRTSGRR